MNSESHHICGSALDASFTWRKYRRNWEASYRKYFIKKVFWWSFCLAIRKQWNRSIETNNQCNESQHQRTHSLLHVRTRTIPAAQISCRLGANSTTKWLFVFVEFAETAALDENCPLWWNDIRKKAKQTSHNVMIIIYYTNGIHFGRSCTGIHWTIFAKSVQRRAVILISLEPMPALCLCISHYLYFIICWQLFAVSVRFHFIFGKCWCSWTVACEAVIVRDTTTTRKVDNDGGDGDVDDKCWHRTHKQSVHKAILSFDVTTQSMNEWRLDVVNIAELLLFYYEQWTLCCVLVGGSMATSQK